MSENDRLAEIKARWNAWADDAAKYSADTVYSHPESRERIGRLLADDMRHLLTEVERLRAENAALAGERGAVETLLLDNGYGGAGFASLADAIDATLGELRRLERIVGVPQPERVPWERRVEEVLTRAEAAEAERDRLREAAHDGEAVEMLRRLPDKSYLQYHPDKPDHRWWASSYLRDGRKITVMRDSPWLAALHLTEEIEVDRQITTPKEPTDADA